MGMNQKVVDTLEGKDILCMASSNWHDLWVNSQHIMWRLAARNRVLYVDSLGLRTPSIKSRDLVRVVDRFEKSIRGISKKERNLWVLSPLVLPFHGSRIISSVNKSLLLYQVKKGLKQLSMRKLILWIFLPNAVNLVGKLGERLVIYHCVDNYASNPGVPRAAIAKMEDQLLEKADLVFAASPKLYALKAIKSSDIYLLPNVADVELFSRARLPLDIPSDIEGLSKPLIGYVGNISEYKVDIDLIHFIGENRRDWTLLLIGPIGHGDPSTNISKLQSLSNVHILGPRPYDKLPAYLKYMDVCIIPFKLNEYTLFSFPMKFHEYLAAGKKIVSTPLPSLEKYKAVTYFGSTPEEFCSRVMEALAEEISPREWLHRDELLSSNSWDHRIEHVSRIISKHMENHVK
jgi:glycosyltransferase involved in cell wall biosynthesis